MKTREEPKSRPLSTLEAQVVPAGSNAPLVMDAESTAKLRAAFAAIRESERQAAITANRVFLDGAR